MYDHELYKEIMFAAEQMFFDEAEEDGYLKTDFCLIVHPKYKQDVVGLIDKIPVIFSYACKEDKFYVVTDPDLVKQARELLGKEKPHERDLIDQFREAFNKAHGIEEEKDDR